MQTKQMLVSDRLAMNPKYVTDLYKDGLTLRITIALLSGMLATTAPAAPGTLANSPLYLVQKTIPNIFFEVDDSGSMDWEILTKKHWEPCAYDANYPALIGDNDCGAGDAVFEGMLQSLPGPDGGAAYPLPYSEFPYIYNNADNIYNPYGSGCTGTWNTGPVYTPNLESCPPDSRYYEWRAYTPAVNVLYYNPAITYKPWQNGDGTSMPDADFTQARSNPRDSQTGYNQIRDLAGFVYEEWHDSHGFSGTRPQRGSNINRTVGANGIVDFWDEHTRYIVNANDITVESIGYTPDGTGKLQPTVTSTTTVTDAATLVEVKQNIANWYQYYRRRSFVAKAAIAKVIDDNPSFRYGFNVINASTPFVEVPSVADLPPFITHNTGLLQSFFEYKWQPIGTPLRGGLNRAGEYFENTD
uniref:hypothetical protein n=1 Tax=Crenothrix polyspora TaxID=360316 RepID=UPI001C4E8FBA